MAPGASRTIIQLAVERIRIPAGRRPLDEAHVANLMVSFQEIGQRHAIEVRPLADLDPAREHYGYDLVAGRHRLEAARRLGWRRIDAVPGEENAYDTQIAEVDENLVRLSYNALERAQAVAARLEAFAAKHPDRAISTEDGATAAKRGRPQKLRHGAAISTMGFSEETAERSGLSKRTVERDLAVYRGIPAGLQARLLGTPIAANPGLLRQLAALPDKDEQAKVAAVLLQGETKSLSDALAIANGRTPSSKVQTPVDQSLKAFRTVWKAATPSARAAILHELAGIPLPKGWIVKAADHE